MQQKSNYGNIYINEKKLKKLFTKHANNHQLSFILILY